MKIVQNAYAKINWAIDVIGIRQDGYHEINMLMQTIELHDEITFISADELTLDVSPSSVPRDDRNLIIKAAKALIEYSGTNHGAAITLKKRIPIRAGLGGGSADCAAALIALNKLWGLKIPLPKLSEIGAGLGKDVPFCMGLGGARVYGTGEKLLRLKSGIKKFLVIVHPGMGLSTADVYLKWDEMSDSIEPVDIERAQKALIEGDMKTLGKLSRNALEPAAVALMPDIATAKEELMRLDAEFVAMTGSGSAVFAVYDTITKAKNAISRLGRRALLTRTL